ncbi:MAG: SDR family oxidoreductase [Candidatus Limnocylindria bacterium]
MPMDLGLNGKVALVAAASKGLGRAIAEEFAREGAKVAMCSREQSAITGAADDIRKKTKGDVLPIAADLSTQGGCETFINKAVAHFGALDILIVNAGGPPPGRFDDLDDAAWHKAVDLTLFSAVRLTRLALPQMRKQKGGSIVYSTSTSVRQPTQYLNLILSNAIRASVHGMLKTLSSDLAKDGIRVNAVQPGRIATDRLIQLDTDTAKRQNTTPEAVRKRYEDSVIPMGRYGDPAEYAAAVVFIASPKASYITGVSLQVDGGMLMSMF